MAIDSAQKRRSALNYLLRVFRNGPIPDGDLDNWKDRRHMLHHYSGSWENTIYVFDVRMMDKSIEESGGKAVGNDYGAISYIFDDMENNSGKVTLPYG